MSDTLNHWDTRIRPHLSSIESGTRFAAYYMAQVHTAISLLPEVPDFDTRAHDGLMKAEEQVRAILESIVAAREAYERLPVETRQLEAAE